MKVLIVCAATLAIAAVMILGLNVSLVHLAGKRSTPTLDKDTEYTNSKEDGSMERFIDSTFIASEKMKYLAKLDEHCREKKKIEMFSIAILTYQRTEVLKHTLEYYIDQEIPSLQKILVLWNDIETEPPEELADLAPPSFLHVIKTKKNSLNNRFDPQYLNLLETEAVFSCDDDVRIDKEHLEFAFEIWKTERDRIVGFPYRTYAVKEETFVYLANTHTNASLSLTGASFFSKQYSHLYQKPQYTAIREYIDAALNCEDIALNMMVSNSTKKPPIIVKNKIGFGCSECHGDTLHQRRGHWERRNECLSYFISIYGHNPLQHTVSAMSPLHTEPAKHSKHEKVWLAIICWILGVISHALALKAKEIYL